MSLTINGQTYTDLDEARAALERAIEEEREWVYRWEDGAMRYRATKDLSTIEMNSLFNKPSIGWLPADGHLAAVSGKTPFQAGIALGLRTGHQNALELVEAVRERFLHCEVFGGSAPLRNYGTKSQRVILAVAKIREAER